MRRQRRVGHQSGKCFGVPSRHGVENPEEIEQLLLECLGPEREGARRLGGILGEGRERQLLVHLTVFGHDVCQRTHRGGIRRAHHREIERRGICGRDGAAHGIGHTAYPLLQLGHRVGEPRVGEAPQGEVGHISVLLAQACEVTFEMGEATESLGSIVERVEHRIDPPLSQHGIQTGHIYWIFSHRVQIYNKSSKNRAKIG